MDLHRMGASSFVCVFLCRNYIYCIVVSARVRPRGHSMQITMVSVNQLVTISVVVHAYLLRRDLVQQALSYHGILCKAFQAS
jgi:hypothetical protein